MSTNQEVLQKPITKTELTNDQSQKLIQTMLTMSFGCLAFLRGLFPDDNFVDQRFVPEKISKGYNKHVANHANSIKIKTLVRGKSTEADVFLDWLEKGVFQSIRLKYLNALSLGVFTDEKNPADLLENYVFTFDYNKDNSMELEINLDENQTIKNTLLDSRKMVQQLMRRFIILTQSLEPLPAKKFLSMRLMFNDKTPSDYQPSLFKDASLDKRPTLNLPINCDLESSKVGTLDTRHHQLSLRVLSVNDVHEGDMTDSNYLQNYQRVDPLNLADIECQKSDEIKNNAASLASNETSNILANILRSSQPSILPTQALPFGNCKTISCECKLDCPSDATRLRQCKTCKKYVHSVCYGNVSNQIESCISCIYGPDLFTDSHNFQDLMMLRKCYRYLSRKRQIPSSIHEFLKSIILESQITDETIQRISFCLSVYFKDDVLTLNQNYQQNELNENKLHSQSYSGTDVLIDVDGIITPDSGELQKGLVYIWQFKYRYNNAQPCYADTLPTSKKQIEQWLNDIRDIRKTFNNATAASLNLSSLILNDTNAAEHDIDIADHESIGVKRKKNDLDEIMNEDPENSEMREHNSVPKKIQKISVSKKTLKSIW